MEELEGSSSNRSADSAAPGVDPSEIVVRNPRRYQEHEGGADRRIVVHDGPHSHHWEEGGREEKGDSSQQTAAHRNNAVDSRVAAVKEPIITQKHAITGPGRRKSVNSNAIKHDIRNLKKIRKYDASFHVE